MVVFKESYSMVKHSNGKLYISILGLTNLTDDLKSNINSFTDDNSLF